MNDSDDGMIGVMNFAAGGALLLFGIYLIIENAEKPWIEDRLFMLFCVFPVGFIAFFLIGLGLRLLLKSMCSQRIFKVQNFQKK